MKPFVLLPNCQAPRNGFLGLDTSQAGVVRSTTGRNEGGTRGVSGRGVPLQTGTAA